MPVTQEFIESLLKQNQMLLEKNNTLIEQVDSLSKTIDELNATIKELREQLNKNSGNSSKPPSSDGFKKVPKSLREKSGKKRGGQKGHQGTHLAVLSKPDEVKQHMHADCNSCPYRDKCAAKACVKETRNVIDAVVEVNITAHEKLCVEVCPLCGESKTGVFPKDVKANVQYGKNLQALVVAFNTVGAVSVNRLHEILGGVFNIPLSTGTIKNIVSRCAEKIKPALDTTRRKLSESPLVHCDETGTNIDGKLHWVHNVSNGSYTYMTVSKKRGYEGIKSVGVLPDYHGIIVHDCWASYWKFDGVTHSVCCAHLLRELNGIIGNHPEQVWAGKFKKLLLRMKKAKDKAVAAGKEALSMFTIQNYKREYNNIIKDAYGENPEPVKPKKKRGRVKRGKILALIDRLQKYKGAVCLFLEKLGVPFDNNQAERDIRNIKTKTKVCGCFRSRTGAEEYMGLMSFISTARKNGFDSYHAVKMALSCQTDQIFVGWL